MTANEKYNSLNEKSAWAYTKQKANFKDIYNSARLFNEIPDIENTNVEEYFKEHYEEYGISTERHRILAIAQMFGLITKSIYYKGTGLTYSNESMTPVFEALKKCSLDSTEFNKIFSEQLIKIKVKSIIDTESYRDDYSIYPFLFLFLVMWNLDKNYSVKKVPYDKVWTYVLTCKKMDDLNDAVNWMIDSSAKISRYNAQYKSDSRFMTIFLECTKMFSLEKGLLSLNHPIADRFYNEFVLKLELSTIQSYLENDNKYKEFLEKFQNFDFDLTDNSIGQVSQSYPTEHLGLVDKLKVEINESKDVSIVIPKIDNVEMEEIIDRFFDNVEEQVVKEARVYDSKEEIEKSNNRKPVLESGLESKKRYSTDPRLSKTALKNAGYVCELSGKIGLNHSTFDSAHGTKYLEAHHLIPMKAQKDYVSLGINLDRLENIVALCPNCHKAVHYGSKEEKIKYLKHLYDERIKRLKEVGIDIDFDTLIDEYYK